MQASNALALIVLVSFTLVGVTTLILNFFYDKVYWTEPNVLIRTIEIMLGIYAIYTAIKMQSKWTV